MANPHPRIFRSLYYRLRCVLLDFTAAVPFAWCHAVLVYTFSRLAAAVAPERSWTWLLRTHSILPRLSRPPALAARFRRQATARLAGQLRRRPAPALPPSISAADRHEASQAGLILKAPREEAGSIVEKGVLLLKFTHRIELFHQSVDMDALLEHYRLVLEPSWSGYAIPEILDFTRYREHPIVVFAPYKGDRELLEALDTNLAPLELGAGDWVDPTVFRPLPNEPKRYDAVMVARWTLIKRHDLLLRALRQIPDPTFRVALLSIRTPGDKDWVRSGILDTLDTSGHRHRIDVYEDLPPGDVNRILNQSKVNLLLSRQEGANRSLFEGFFAGVPGLAFRGHIGMRLEHFGPRTGRLIERQRLAAELLDMRDRYAEFDPRPWALTHIAPEISTRRLNEALRALAHQRGEPWTTDVVAKCNRPHLSYYLEGGSGSELPAGSELPLRFPPRVSHSYKNP